MRSSRLYQSAAMLVVAAFALSACGPDGAKPTASADQAALPLATGEAQQIAPAPVVEALPAAPAVKVVYVNQPEESYAYVDDAYAMSDALGDAPPDYGFDYEDSHPWAWRTAGDALRLYEATSDGDRYYYYRSGESDPYLVRDGAYAYAYSAGNLVTVYDDRGRVLDRSEADRRSEYAGRYLARGRALEAAAAHDHRQQVVAANWAQRQAQVRQDNARWADQQRQSAQWQALHDRQAAQQTAQWQAERTHRQQEAVAFNQWRDTDYKGQSPRVVAANQPAKPAAPNAPFWQRQDQQNRAQQQKLAQQQAQQKAQQQQLHDQQVKAQQDQQRAQLAREDQQRKQQAAQQAQQQKLAAQQADVKRQQAAQLAQKQQAQQQALAKQQAAQQAEAKKQQAVHVAQQKQQAAHQAQGQKQQAVQQKQQANQQAQAQKQQAAQQNQQAQAKRQQAAQVAKQKQQAAKQAEQQAQAKAKAERRPVNKGHPDDTNEAGG